MDVPRLLTFSPCYGSDWLLRQSIWWSVIPATWLCTYITSYLELTRNWQLTPLKTLSTSQDVNKNIFQAQSLKWGEDRRLIVPIGANHWCILTNVHWNKWASSRVCAAPTWAGWQLRLRSLWQYKPPVSPVWPRMGQTGLLQSGHSATHTEADTEKSSAQASENIL